MVLFHLSPYKDFKHGAVAWLTPQGLQACLALCLGQELGHCFADLPSTSRFVALTPRSCCPCGFDSIVIVARGGGSILPMAASERSATTHPSVATGCSKAWGNGAAPPWDGSLASSSIYSSTIRIRSWPSGSQGALPMTASAGAHEAPLRGKVVGDRGYISKSLMQRLWQRGLRPLTSIGRTTKNHHPPHSTSCC